MMNYTYNIPWETYFPFQKINVCSDSQENFPNYTTVRKKVDQANLMICEKIHHYPDRRKICSLNEKHND